MKFDLMVNHHDYLMVDHNFPVEVFKLAIVGDMRVGIHVSMKRQGRLAFHHFPFLKFHLYYWLYQPCVCLLWVCLKGGKPKKSLNHWFVYQICFMDSILHCSKRIHSIRGTHPVLVPVVLQVPRHAGTMSRAAQIVESLLRLKAGASTEVCNVGPQQKFFLVYRVYYGLFPEVWDWMERNLWFWCLRNHRNPWQRWGHGAGG